MRAARCVDPYEAEISRRHNHSNVLCLGERNLSRYDRHSLTALAAAESGVAYAKNAIVRQTAVTRETSPSRKRSRSSL